MSRIGKQPIEIPQGVSVSIDNDNISISGSKGSLSQFTMPGIDVTFDESARLLQVSRQSDSKVHRSKHGLMRTLLNNMVVGVSSGFSKKLEINGVGYRATAAGTGLKLNLGLSHDVNYQIPTGITATVEQNIITVSGFDKQKVGQVAAEIRALKKPEPYKGKGIKYVDERILRKSGKSGKEK
jgi:large subunit ribosomal protein L6